MSKRFRPQLILGLAVLATLAGLAATVTTEVVMVPTSTERTQLIALIVSLAAVAVTVAFILNWFAPRSLTRRMLLAALSGPVIVAVTVSAGSRSMFLSDHDLQFLLILLAFATVLAIGVVFTLGRPLTEDLARLTEVAHRVADGDLEARAELQRMDEVGDLATAIDEMVEQIAITRAERDASERERSITMASLSHDARTPLTSMRLATEALIDGVAPDPERYLHTIAADIASVETLISDLFTLGQLEAGRLRIDAAPTEIMTVVRDVADCLSPIAIDRRVDLRVEGPRSMMACADSTQLHRVIANVTTNAIRHSPEGECVRIRVEPDDLRVSVLDNGTGFPAGFEEEAFHAFRRHDEARERAAGGAGLGLAVAKGIIEALDGRIWAESGPGGTVHLELPAVEPAV
jgi:signal transduction histidine kinase